MSDKRARIRVNVTMTQIYVDALDYLVEEGLFLNRGVIVLAGLRLIFRQHGIEPFCIEPVEEPEESVE